MNNNLMTRIEASRSRLSKGQLRIAGYISEHYDKAAFMTAHRLGEMVNVSESTVVRFATELGYSGYPHMQRELREIVHTRLTSLQRIELAWERMQGQNILSGVMENDIDKIRGAMEAVDAAVFDRAVDMILAAKNIYILGLRTSSFLAGFLGFYFRLLFNNVTVVGGSPGDGDIFENLFRVGGEDVVIGISFPRYSKRTLRGMRLAKDRGAGLIAITDCAGAPISGIGECTLYAPCEMASFVDSLVAPLSLINALVVSIGMKKRGELSETFAVLEDIWDEYETYEKFETDGTERR
ncbi:MAG: MurR/RpiR family transcriptional regulator [Oscillospiraceae bacterium]|jgi:DNA-binding MurR/RpiR family transcriptional regulator|nr:MurR/RpiR family transcriptional regulator [Oscillospiraceae bacterium]